MTTNETKQQDLKNGCIGCLSILVLLVIGFAGCSILFPVKQKTQAEKVDDWYKSASFYGCIRKLKEQLRDPDSYKDNGEYATSGDTGGAAIYGLRGKKKINVFILHPHKRVSPIQEAQMTSVLDANGILFCIIPSKTPSNYTCII